MSLFDKIDITDHGKQQIQYIRDYFENLLINIYHICGDEFAVCEAEENREFLIF